MIRIADRTQQFSERDRAILRAGLQLVREMNWSDIRAVKIFHIMTAGDTYPLPDGEDLASLLERLS
jgi:hypothetical protein